MLKKSVGRLFILCRGTEAPMNQVGRIPASEKATSGLSAEVFLLPLADSRFLVYAPLRRAAFVANATLVNLICDLKDGIRPRLQHSEKPALAFLRDTEILDAGPESLPVSVYQGDPQPTFVTLLLTTACNLRCTYCYASAGDTPAHHMSLAVACQGIDFVSANARRQGKPCFELAFHGGGEPTMNWKTLVGATHYAQARAANLKIDVRMSAATNGVLTEEQIDWLIGNLHGISLSFDDLPESQDKHRLTVHDHGSSARVQHSIEQFDRARFPYGIRVTVTDDQIANLPESIRYICNRFHPERIQVEPAYPMGRWSDAPSAETDRFIAAYRQALHIARELGQDLYFSAARLDTLTNHFCAVSQDGFSLAHDGQVTACYEVFSPDLPHAGTFFYGRPRADGQSFDFDTAAIAHLRQLSVEHKSFCENCFAKWHCAGDCPRRTLCASATGEFQGSERCHITRELITDLILERIRDSETGFWHEPPPAVGLAPAYIKE